MGETLKRPFVVCHMVSALDGRIDGAYFKTQEIKPVLEASNQTRGQLNCDALLYGATTMAETYAAGYGILYFCWVLSWRNDPSYKKKTVRAIK